MQDRAVARSAGRLARRARRALARRRPWPPPQAPMGPPTTATAPASAAVTPGPEAAALPAFNPYAGQLLRAGWLPSSLDDRAREDRRRLLVIHVPKTGGSSLRAMLETHVTPEEVSLSTGAHEWVERSVAELYPVRVFVGHQFLEPLYHFPLDDWVTTLLVRDPLDWWRSYYKYQRRRAEQNPALPQPEQTFGAFIDAGGDQSLSNPQTAWLMARTRVMFDSPHARADRIADTATRRHRDATTTMDLLERLLSRVTALGTTNQLTEVYRTACSAMGWKPAFKQAVRYNRSRLAEEALELTPGQEERLLRLNRIDAWLVERATERVHAGKAIARV